MQPTGPLVFGVFAGAVIAFLTILSVWMMKKKSPDDTLLKTAQKYVPFAGLFVGLFALTFQVTVLYPWHLELSRDLNTLSNKI